MYVFVYTRGSLCLNPTELVTIKTCDGVVRVGSIRFDVLEPPIQKVNVVLSI